MLNYMDDEEIEKELDFCSTIELITSNVTLNPYNITTTTFTNTTTLTYATAISLKTSTSTTTISLH